MRKDGRKRRAVKEGTAVAGDSTRGNSSPVIVVGIGASAGGLKSLKQLFAKMPTGRGVAFVFVTHLEAKRKSQTVKLLANQTSLAVVEAKDGMPLLADRIHVIPPDKYLNITDNILTLREPILCNSLRMPIDHFFCSLALDQRSRSVGILLSGMGSDGTLGLSEIRAAGGRTFVEDPGTAEFPSMPQSAIDAGVADTVLPMKAMSEAIMGLADKVTAGTCSAQTYPPEFDADLRAILDILRAKVGHDFLCYKPNTIIRRIRRRMGLAKIPTFADYIQFLHDHTKEVGLLQKDLLIGVTDFFRQPQAWEILEERIIAPVVDSAHPGSDIRVWVPGCSTGQEAYSLAMLLTEHAEKSGKNLTVQIFATDSDLTSLAIARSGTYSKEDIGENISSGRLKRFFVRKDGHCQIVKDIREQIVFAPQNITADPPFSRLDLISCRNLLIYLDQQVQKKIITLFHFSLREGGFIFLGTSETVGDRSDLFEPVSKKWRIYRRIGVGHRVNVEIPLRPTGSLLPVGSGDSGHAAAKPPLVAPPSRMSLASGAQHMLLDRFAPACVMIDRKLQVLYVHGSVENYLTFPPGELTTRVVDMAREGLRARLRGAITKCLETNKSVSIHARVRRGKKSVPVKVIVSPLRYPREIDGLLLITFEDYFLPAPKSRRQAVSDSSIRQMEDELKVTREELHSTIEQLENSNDQLKASNEEVMAANEELQSANEELETSKEELQSLNEELNTINIRLEEKVDELEGVNNDVVNLLSSTSIATVFLDKELKVKRYTPAITRLLSLISTDTGRPFADILRRFTDETLLDDARRVLDDLMPQDSEVQGDDGRWYIRRITPYRTHDDRIEGVVITFVDVADLKEAEEALRQLNAELEHRVNERTAELRAASLYARSLIEAGLGPLVTISPEGRITDVNEATEQITGRTRRELIGTDFSDYFTDPSSAQTGYRNVLADGQVRDYPLTIRHKSGNTTAVLYNATVYRNQAGEVQGVFAAARDVTELKRVESALKKANETLEQRVMERTAELHESRHRLAVIVDSIADGFFAIDREWRFTHVNDEALRHFHKKREDVVGHAFLDVFPEARGGIFETEYGSAMESGEPVHFESPSLVSDLTVEVHAYPGPENLTVLFRDITEKHRMATALREARDRAEWLARFPDENPNPVMRVLADGNVLYCNPASAEIPGWSCEVGEQLSDPFLALIERATIERQEIQQDVEMGEQFYSIAVVPIPGEGYANVYGRDITERKQAADALQTALQRLHALVSNIHNSILFVGEDGIELANQAFCDYFELQASPAYLIGLTPRKLIEKIKNAYLHPEEEVTRIREIVGRGQNVIGEEITMQDGRTCLRDFIPIHVDGKSYGRLWCHTDITGRKQLELMLQRNLKEHQIILNSVPAMVFYKDRENRFIRTNKAFEGVMQLPKEALEGKSLFDLYPQEQAEAYWKDDQEVMASGKAKSGIVEPMQTPAGARLVQTDKVPYVDEKGNVIGVIGFAVDITEQRQAEEALRDSESRFRLLSATAGRLLRAEDPQTIVEGLCRNVMTHMDCQAFFNFLVDEKAGRLRLNTCAGIPEEDVRVIEWLDYGVAVCGCVARDRTRIIAEDIFHTPDVRTDLIKSFGIQAYCCHPLMAQDHLIGTLSFGTKTRQHFTPEEVELMRMVTDQVAVAMQRKQTEQMVLHAKQEWERTFDAVPDLIAILDDHHHILRANKAMAERLGVAPQQCVGETCHKAVHGLDYPPDFCPHTLALADGQEHVEEVHEDCLGGDFLVSATPLTDELGRLIGSVHVARDITKRKQAEQILLERTAELEALNRELESFSYSVSHDLRAPLRAIDGYARSILKKQEDKFDEDTKRRFNDIRLNAKMMGQLIDDLLAFSRLGKKHMSISKLDMDAVIMDVWKELQTANPERDMKLTLNSMPRGYGDRTLIKQVYFNLLSNAVKFTKFRDAAHIEAGGYTEGNEDVYYLKDNGVGFDMAYYDKLFGVFQRLHNPDDFEGTGVGLATIQRIVHRHEGRVWAEGKVDEGATFYFSLPRKG